MQLSNMPDYKAHLSRHGHNLSHDFTFTSSTGHLLTVFAQHMNPKEHIKGHINLFSRTQPLVGCPNVDIEEFIDYFFVPYDMIWSGFGDSLFQVNEPFSRMITLSDGSLPVYNFQVYDLDAFSGVVDITNGKFDVSKTDWYGLDCRLLSQYRNLFHNFLNPNVVCVGIVKEMVNPNTTKPHWLVPEDFYQPSVFPAVLAAYNCVYQHFYRLDDREVFDAQTYNIDEAVYGSDSLNTIWHEKFFDIKYRSRQFDYFTAGSVSPLINSTNIKGGPNNSSLLDINNYLASFLDDKLQTQSIDASTIITPRSIGSAGSVGYANANYVPSTASLRSLFAVEKLLSVTNRAKKTYDAQVMAHFGVNVPTDYKHQIQFIGQQKGNIHVGEIISTAGTSDNALGDIAGKGYGNVNTKDIDFTAPCHGIVIGIFSCVPKVRYYTPLIKQWQLTNRLDFFLPAFEHLGMQPIFQWECAAIPYSWSYKSSLNWTSRTSVEGWQMRYQQFKQQISRVSPAFTKTLFSSYNEQGDPNLYAQGFNEWSSWVISQRPYDINFVPNNNGILTLTSFLAGPTMLNDIMAVQYPDVRQHHVVSGNFVGGYFDAYDSTFWAFDSYDAALVNRKSFLWNTASLFYRDPLIHFADCQFKLVSLMSDNTLPELAAV